MLRYVAIGFVLGAIVIGLADLVRQAIEAFDTLIDPWDVQ